MFLTNNPFSDHGPSKQVLSEAFKYHIPEDIPANERTAFHGAAAAAAKAGKKNFNFGGKTHPVTMKKDLANKIADQKEALDDKDKSTVKKVIKGLKKAVNIHKGQAASLTKDIKDDVKKESTMTFREKLVSLYEGDRAAHYKGATKPEEYDEKQKSSKGAMDMLKTPRSTEADGMKAAKDTAANIAKSAPGRKMRNNDKKDGDANMIPSATPVKDPAAKMQTAEGYGVSGNKVSDSLIDAVSQVTELSKKTLGSYSDKAAKQISKTLTDPNRRPTDKFGHSSQLKKRQRGMDSATLKRSKERGKERLIHDLGMRPGKAAPAAARNA